MKLDGGTGEVLWSLHYASPGAENESTYAIDLDSAGNAFITGRAWVSGHEDEFSTFMIDADTGDIVWDEFEGGVDNLDDFGLDIAVGPDDAPVSIGMLQNADASATLMVVKYYAASGGIDWAVSTQEIVNDQTSDGWVRIDAAGDVVVCVKTWGGSTSFDVTLLKYDGDDGTLLWSEVYTNGTAADDPADMILDDAGNPIVVGVTAGDYLTAKFDGSDGDHLWTATYAGPQGWYDVANCVTLSDQGEILVSGFSDGTGTSWDVATIGYEPDFGEQNWALRYDGVENLTDEAKGIHIDADGTLLVTGYCYSNTTSMDQLVLSYDNDTGTGVGNTPAAPVRLAASPNPFNPATTFAFEMATDARAQLKVYDLAGRCVATLFDGHATAGPRQVTWSGRADDGERLPSGTYLARLRTDRGVSSRKVVLAK